jgi:outer membrane protein
MKNISTILAALSLLLTGILFFLFFNRADQGKKNLVASEKTSSSSSAFKIAYFEMDSLEVHYNYFKDAEAQAKVKENSMNMELSSLQNKYQKKIADWQQKGSTMTQAEGQQAQQEYAEMQQTFQARKEALQEELAKKNGQVMTDIKLKIETFLKEYNKQKNYSFIMAYEPNSFIYYKDSVYNITNDIIEGLNATYKKKD